MAERVDDVRAVDESRRAVAGLEIGDAPYLGAVFETDDGLLQLIEPDRVLGARSRRRRRGGRPMKPPGVVDRLLADRIGLDPATVGEGLIARGVLARMSALGLRDRGEYERVLAGSPESSRRWSRRWWSRRAGSSATPGRSRSSATTPGRDGWSTRPGRRWRS